MLSCSSFLHGKQSSGMLLNVLGDARIHALT